MARTACGSQADGDAAAVPEDVSRRDHREEAYTASAAARGSGHNSTPKLVLHSHWTVQIILLFCAVLFRLTRREKINQGFRTWI